MKQRPVPVLLGIMVAACSASVPESVGFPDAATDQASVQGAPAPTSTGSDRIEWVIETEPVPSSRDAADDPAIWVDRDHPERTVIIGTDKKGDAGLLVYDLAGEVLGSAGDEAMNNVDLQEGVPVGDRSAVIVAATAIQGRTIELFELDTTERSLEPIDGGSVDSGVRGGGICLGSHDGASLPVFVTRGNGGVQHWVATFGEEGADVRLVRELSFGSRIEGCVVDDEAGTLYLAEEAEGIWRTDVDPASTAEPVLVGPVDAGWLTPDVEGLAVAHHAGTRYLVVSSQGDDTFVVYRIDPAALAWIGDFQVSGPDGDGVTHTDGIEVTTEELPPPFTSGILVVQDDSNGNSEDREANQNFKLVPWAAVTGQLGID